jgi:hypothetical protein
MIEWLAVRAEHRDEVARALARAWKGSGAAVADLAFPKGVRVSFVSPGGAVARRAARWPDLLADWRDIYEDRLFPTDAVPVLAEEASALGAEVLAAHAEPGLARASVGWYRKGVLAEYEHVGSAQVAWTPPGGRGRPVAGTRPTGGAMATKRLAEVLGATQVADTLERLEKTSKAVGEALLAHAFIRLIGEEPPPMDELAGRVAAAERPIDLGVES